MIKIIFIIAVILSFMSGCKGLFEPESASATISDSLKTDSFIRTDSFSLSKPASIELCSLSNSSISVTGVGGVENSRIYFKIKDTAGVPVRGKYIIHFYKNAPDSGGYLLNPIDTTLNGLVECIYKSGTAAGVCGITAKYETITQVIASSQVVRIIVSGGPVVERNFLLVPERRNVPYMPGSIIYLTAYCFDKYGNPSVPTMVYFSATAGGIGAGGLTDSMGKVTTTYTLAGTIPDSMKALVTASTRTGSGSAIYSSEVLLFSGAPIITITHPASPSDTFRIPTGKAVTLNVSVKDSLGHPLAGGTKILFSLTGGGELVGNMEITLPDAVSGNTQFEIMVKDDGKITGYTYFLVDVSGPNGNRKSGIWGIVR